VSMVLLRVAQGAAQLLALVGTNLSRACNPARMPIQIAHNWPSLAPQARDGNRAGKRVRALVLGAIVPMNVHNGQRTYARMEQTKLSTKQIRTNEMMHLFPPSCVSYGCAPSRFATESSSPAPSIQPARLARKRFAPATAASECTARASASSAVVAACSRCSARTVPRVARVIAHVPRREHFRVLSDR